MGEFNANLRGFVNQLHKAFPDYKPLRKLRNEVKQKMANSPDALMEAFASFFEGDQDAVIALRNGDVETLTSLERVVRCPVGALAVKLWGGMSVGSKDASRRHLLSLAAAAGLDEGADPGLATGARAWSLVFSEVMGKRVLVPAAFLGKMEQGIELLRDLAATVEEDDIRQEDLEELLDGVDLDLGTSDAAEPEEDGLSGVLKALLPRFKEVMGSDRRIDSAEVATYALAKLKDERCAKIVATLWSAFSNVQSRYLQSALSKAANAVDLSSVEAAADSIRSIDPRDFEEEMRGLAKGVDASKLQAVARSMGELLETSGMAGAFGVRDAARKLGGMLADDGPGGSGGVLSGIMSSDAAPGMISQIPAAIGEDGSLDLGRAAALAMRSRRVPKRPRITGRS
jgi:hypothetical protein